MHVNQLKQLISSGKLAWSVIVLSAALASSSMNSAMAKEDTGDQPSGSKTMLSRLTALPLAAAGVTTGICVGVPVRIAKDTARYTRSMKTSLNDGMAVEPGPDVVGHSFSGASALLFGIPSGIVHGSVEGVRTGVEAGKRKPFSKESMSLVEAPPSSVDAPL